MASDLLKKIQGITRDMGHLLFHWTRAIPATSGSAAVPAADVLGKILTDGRLEGSTNFIKGNHKCVCFSEAPITEAVSLFKVYEQAALIGGPRYEPYGIAVKKEWLFARSGDR